MSDRITVFRLVWKRAGLTMRSDWTIHHDVVRRFLEEKREEMPGVEPRIERGSVDSVEIEEYSALDQEAEAVEDVGETHLAVASRQNHE